MKHSALGIKYFRFRHQSASNFSTLHWQLRIFLQPFMLMFTTPQLSTILDIPFCRAHNFILFLQNSLLFKPFCEFHIFSMLYSTAVASLFTCIFEKFVRLAMDNEVGVVYSCLKCVLEKNPGVYIPTKHCRCVLRTYRALSSVHAIERGLGNASVEKRESYQVFFVVEKT